ncbi:hypothetical protein [Halobaculum sp. MBLA0143]|uniref:hypothetical protein n=1 Tax=Halobaculum sp. MBLA0143 TaxID=3079933 RepID=UPI003523D256
MGSEEPFGDRGDEEEPDNLFQRFRTTFSLVAVAALLVAAAGAATVGGLVASGVGGEPLQRPAGDAFSFRVNTTQEVTSLEIGYAEGSVPNVERVYVVSGTGERIAWTAASAGTGDVALISGTESPMPCLRAGNTYRIVFEGRATSGTIAAYQLTEAISSSSGEACREAKAETETPGF